MASHDVGSFTKNTAGRGILAEYYILLAIVLILIVARNYAALRITHIYDAADVTILIATAFFIVGAAMNTIIVHLGAGQHLDDLKDPVYQARQINRWNTYYQIINVFTTFFTRCSISAYILRIRNDRIVKIVLGATMLLLTLTTIASTTVLALSCRPLKKLWNPTIPGSCLSPDSIYLCTYVQSGFTILSDLVLTISPIAILWNVKIRRGQKIFVSVLMSLGLIATAMSALRNVFVSELSSPDFTYKMIPVVVVANAELGIALIAACIPSCIPIVTHRMRMRKRARKNSHSSRLFTMNQGPSYGSRKNSTSVSNAIHSSTGEPGSSLDL